MYTHRYTGTIFPLNLPTFGEYGRLQKKNTAHIHISVGDIYIINLINICYYDPTANPHTRTVDQEGC
jgi:hypothetical protein